MTRAVFRRAPIRSRRESNRGPSPRSSSSPRRREARKRGGTLNAGLQALEIGRPVFAVAYADDPPAGNQILFERGVRSLRSQNELLAALDELAVKDEAEQLAID
jgi:hypothetical protein